MQDIKLKLIDTDSSYQREGEGGSRGDRGVVIYDDRK